VVGVGKRGENLCEKSERPVAHAKRKSRKTGGCGDWGYKNHKEWETRDNTKCGGVVHVQR